MNKIEYDFFYPYSEIFNRTLKGYKKTKKIKIREIHMVTARLCGKTNEASHFISFLVLQQIKEMLPTAIYAIRNSKDLTRETVHDLFKYIRKFNPYIPFKSFNQGELEIHYKGLLDVFGYHINIKRDKEPIKGIRTTQAPLIIEFVDERCTVPKEQLQDLERTIRSDDNDYQLLRIYLSNPEGYDLDYALEVFNILNLPLDIDGVVKAEPNGFTLKQVGNKLYFHCQTWINKYLPKEQLEDLEIIKLTNPRVASVVYYGIPKPLSGAVYSNYEMLNTRLLTELDVLCCGIDIGYTDIDSNGGRTCLQFVGLNLNKGLCSLGEWTHHNADNPLPSNVILDTMYDYFKKQYNLIVNQFPNLNKILKVYVDEEGASNYLQNKLSNDDWEYASLCVFRSTRLLDKNSWKNIDRATDENTWIALGLLRYDKNINKDLDNCFRNCQWVKTRNSLAENDIQQVARYHKYTDSLNAFEYAIWERRHIVKQLAKSIGTALIERNKI